MDSLPTSQRVALDWLNQGRRVVAASLIETVGSAPLDPGAEMLVDDEGRIEGSVTGGCVEGALVEEARAVLAGGPSRVVSYGIADSDAVDVGLMCGGTVRIFVHEIDASDTETLEAVVQAAHEDRPVALATILDGEQAGHKIAISDEGVVGGSGAPPLLQHSIARDSRGYLDEGRSAIRSYSAAGEVLGSELRVYIQAFASSPIMVIFGAIDFSAALARMAEEIGFRVTICDARMAFAASPRFSQHAEVVVDWPDRYLAGRTLGPRDAVLVFTHDPKFDEPALGAALVTGAGYIGALGSRRTHHERLERLRAAGLAKSDLERISAPCGLDIGARTPSETAISVLAEMLALRADRAGGRLANSEGPIHGRSADMTDSAQANR